MNEQSNFSALLASNTGKRLFNTIYSWGAAIVIIGAMFKILHFPYANAMLMLGMVTEAVVFFISGFDESQAGIEHPNTINNNGNVGDTTQGVSYAHAPVVGAQLPFSPEYAEKMATAAQSMDGFAQIMDSLNEVSLSLLTSYKKITDSSQGVSASSEGFSQNIQALNQNVLGLNGVYEAQFESVKDQMTTIKFMNESLERIKGLYDGAITDSTTFRSETEKMTKQIEALNQVYARLLQAMTAGNPTSPIV